MLKTGCREVICELTKFSQEILDIVKTTFGCKSQPLNIWHRYVFSQQQCIGSCIWYDSYCAGREPSSSLFMGNTVICYTWTSSQLFNHYRFCLQCRCTIKLTSDLHLRCVQQIRPLRAAVPLYEQNTPLLLSSLPSLFLSRAKNKQHLKHFSPF